MVQFPALRLPLLFLVCVLPLGLVLARLTPMAEVPDETAHIVRAYAVATGQWIGHRIPPPPGDTVPQAGYDVDTGLFATAFASHEPGGLVTAPLEAARDAARWSNQTAFAYAPNTASYAPVFYLLSGGALGVARALGAEPEGAIAAARVANLLGFALLGAVAMLVARGARYTLFALLCLPSGLSLAASVNQDGLLIAAVVLAVALLTRREPVARLWAAPVLAAVCLAKPPYLPLVALLLVPAEGWSVRGVARGAGLGLLAAVPGVLWSVVALRRTVVPFFTGPYAPGGLYTGATTSFTYTDSAAQLAILRHDPSLILRLPVGTAHTWWRVWLNEIVGVLGQLSLVLPPTLYHAWFVALACAVLGDVVARRPAAAPWRPMRAVAALVGAGCAALLVFTVQYLTWTHVGEPTVSGVQGRYFVPLLAAAALALPAVPLLAGRTVVFLMPTLATAIAGLAVIPPLIVRRWFLH